MNKYLCAQCEHPFSHPLVLTNNSGGASETYYACPYCLSKIDMDEKDLVAAFREKRKATGFIDNPAKNLNPPETVRKNITIPDECLDCANLLPCVHTLIMLIESKKENPERKTPVCKFL